MPDGIHQEVRVDAGRAQVYRALTDADHFAKMTGAPATLTDNEGGAFSLFGGFITGRNIELIPDSRLVQAWRCADWPEGVYSIVRFQLNDQGDKATEITFNHTGFPEGQQDHLAEGWMAKYWEPLKTHLAAAG